MKRVDFEQKLLNNGATSCSKTVTRTVTHLIVQDLKHLGKGSKVIAAKKSPICTIVTEQWIVDQWNVNATSSRSTDASVFPIDACMLANKYVPSKHANKVLGWCMSEKLDGLRAVCKSFFFFCPPVVYTCVDLF